MVMTAAAGILPRHQVQWAAATKVCPKGITNAQKVPMATPLATDSCCNRHRWGCSRWCATGRNQVCWAKDSRVGNAFLREVRKLLNTGMTCPWGRCEHVACVRLQETARKFSLTFLFFKNEKSIYSVKIEAFKRTCSASGDRLYRHQLRGRCC